MIVYRLIDVVLANTLIENIVHTVGLVLLLAVAIFLLGLVLCMERKSN